MNDFNNIFKSKKNLDAVVNDLSESSEVKYIKRITGFLIVVLISFAFADYFLGQI